ncbi:MAG: glycosyltransferase family 2 protein [Actinobacteria bacterium]|nr:MAG: glycosyltransferase family 2 protein [Actinomycetota bacterium]
MKDVTVSVVHASGPELTLECLESLDQEHARRASVEVVLLDNASDDGLVAAVHERFPAVRVIEQRRRAGFGENHNTIIRATESRYVFVLNPDTQVPAGTIDALVDYLDARPEAALAGPRIRGFDGRQQFSALRLMSIPVQLAWALSLGQVGTVVSHGETPKPVGAVSGCAFLIRRDAFERAGLFDEEFFMYCEEADVARRLERLGLERHYVPTVEVLHHRLQSTVDMPERRINEFWRSLELYLERHHAAVERGVLRFLTGAGYALAAVAATVGRRLPETARPSIAGTWDERAYRLHARNAFRGVQGPGLRELAEEWNRTSAG